MSIGRIESLGSGCLELLFLYPFPSFSLSLSLFLIVIHSFRERFEDCLMKSGNATFAQTSRCPNYLRDYSEHRLTIPEKRLRSLASCALRFAMRARSMTEVIIRRNVMEVRIAQSFRSRKAQDGVPQDRLDGIERIFAYTNPSSSTTPDHDVLSDHSLSVSCGITTDNLRRDELFFPTLFFIFFFFYGHRATRRDGCSISDRC